MKGKKQDMSIRELFRQKLENAEIIPDASVSSKLMQKLARREFLRFNPSRFNIYYLGGILIIAVTTIVLSSRAGDSDKLPNPDISNKPGKTVNIENSDIPVNQNVIQKEETVKEKVSGSKQNKPISRSEIGTVKEPAQNIESRENITVTHNEVTSSLAKDGLFTDSSIDKNKLRSKLNRKEVFFEWSESKGCAPLKIQFKNKLTDFDSCRWTFGDGGTSTSKNTEWLFDVEGEYKVILKVFSSNAIETTLSTLITVYPKPLARFEISPDKVVLPNDEIHFINYSVDAVKFKWDFGDGSSSEQLEPYHKYTKFGKYNVGLVVTSEYGCSDSLVVLNAFTGLEYFIDFPNAFMPNMEGPTGGLYSLKSDETAQVFHPTFSGVSEYQLKIFSKLGQLIFESSDVNIGWDGYFKGQLSNPGVYIWKVRGNFRNGEPFIKMGDVTLLRY